MKFKLPQRFVKYLDDLTKSPADEIIGRSRRTYKRDNHEPAIIAPFMFRWYVIPKNRWLNVYYHNFVLDDDDRALHCHPWWNLSILVHGKYIEHTIAAGGVHRREIVEEGQWKFRSATAAHRVELDHGRPTCSLFITGPVIRKWGFHCPSGWITHNEFSHRGGCGDDE